MGTTILSFSDRIVIETLRHEKRSLRYIADYLGFSKTTIFNEIHRLKGEYHATSAQADHETKLSYRGRKCSLTANLKRLIEDKIKIQKWSIEQVAIRISIFQLNGIHLKLLPLPIEVHPVQERVLRHFRRPFRLQRFQHRRCSIEDRPAEASDRNIAGHFEADTVLSGKRKGQAVATFVERKSRLTIVKRLGGRDSTSMTKAILELANQLGTNLKTLTVDHGKEFANYQSIEKNTGVPLYFAHAYSPHERGSNENRNRVLRRFIPKGQPIEEISDDELIQINWYLNSRPLKCLNWRTPIEIFLLNLRH